MAKKTQQKQAAEKDYGSEAFFADKGKPKILDAIAEYMMDRTCFSRVKVNRKMEAINDKVDIIAEYLARPLEEIEWAIEDVKLKS